MCIGDEFLLSKNNRKNNSFVGRYYTYEMAHVKLKNMQRLNHFHS